MNGLKFLKKKCPHLEKNTIFKIRMKEFFNYSARPELDTIRLFIKVDREKCELRKFFDEEFSREICTIEPLKDENGNFILDSEGRKAYKPIWEKKRLDHRFSSYNKKGVNKMLRFGEDKKIYEWAKKEIDSIEYYLTHDLVYSLDVDFENDYQYKEHCNRLEELRIYYEHVKRYLKDQINDYEQEEADLIMNYGSYL